VAGRRLGLGAQRRLPSRCTGSGRGRAWLEFTLHGLQPLDLARPATHVSLYEADAYARWAARACRRRPNGNSPPRAEVETGGDLHPAAAGSAGLAQMFGHCWQWTSSSYAPYPGYAPAPARWANTTASS
jgi:formylglycine-generating enzyme required for sulfatase activity